MSGWQTLRLGDVTTKVGSGSTPRGGETAYKASGVPLIRSMNVHFDGFRTDGLAYLDDEQAAALRNVEVQAGDVLLNITGASIGRVTVAPASMHGARVNQHVCIVRPDSRLKASFLRWHLASPSQQRLINSIESGATRQALTKEKILGFDVPLPSLGEQEATVAEIEKQFSRLDEAVAGLRRVKANLKRYKASVLKAAVEGRLVPSEAELARREGRPYETGAELLLRILAKRHSLWQGKGKYKEPAAPETSNLPELPEGWCWSSLGQSFPVAVGATPSRKHPEYWGGEIPWVSSGEVQFGRVSTTGEHISQLGLANSSRQLNPAGSVLLAMIGQGRTRGQAAILDIPAANNQNSAAIWVSATPIPSLFVFYWLMARYEETRQIGSGNNQQALNKSLVEGIPLPLPPLAEQHRIVAEVDRRLSIAREVEAEVEANLRRAQALRQSILDRAFTPAE